MRPTALIHSTIPPVVMTTSHHRTTDCSCSETLTNCRMEEQREEEDGEYHPPHIMSKSDFYPQAPCFPLQTPFTHFYDHRSKDGRKEGKNAQNRCFLLMSNGIKGEVFNVESKYGMLSMGFVFFPYCSCYVMAMKCGDLPAFY